MAPNAVRVWRGFRLAPLSIDQFCDKLATVFVPATVKMQSAAGLCAYVPSVPAGVASKPDLVPDETALLFWESPETYWNGFATLAVRTYTLTHSGVYATENQQSRADFPVRFTETLTADQPIYLFDRQADWMHGNVIHFVGSRPVGLSPDAFHAAIADKLRMIQKTVSLNGAIACAAQDYVVYWELGPRAPGLPTPPTGVPLLRSVSDWSRVFIPAATHLAEGLWDTWTRMDVVSGSSFNMQFERRERS